MGADEDDFGTLSADFDFDVVTGTPIQFVRVSPWLQADPRKGILNEFGSSVELRITNHVSFADVARECLYIPAQFFSKRHFIRRQRRCNGDILSRHSHSEPPQ